MDVTAEIAAAYSEPWADLPAFGGRKIWREGNLFSLADVVSACTRQYYRAKVAHDDPDMTEAEREAVYTDVMVQLEAVLDMGDALIA